MKTKTEIILMTIPIFGIAWILNRIIPNIREVSWWDIEDKKPILLLIGLTFYQILCLIGLKMINLYIIGGN